MAFPLTYLHYLTPLVLVLPLTSFLVPSSLPLPPIPGIRPIRVQTITPRRSLILTILFSLALTSFADIIILVADILTARSRYGVELPSRLKGHALAGEVLYALGGFVVWGLAIVGVVWRKRFGGKGLVMLVLLALVLEIPNLVGLVLREIHSAGYNRIFAVLALVPSILRILLLPILLTAMSNPRVTYEKADETTSLVNHGNGDGRTVQSAAEYGTFENGPVDPNKSTSTTPQPTNGANTPAPAPATPAPPQKIKMSKKLGQKKEEKKTLAFKDAWPKFKVLVPKLWPSTSRKLQFYVAMTGFFLVIQRVLNPLGPISLGLVVRALANWRNSIDVWKALILYLIVRLINGWGIMGLAQQFFWIPVVQYTDKEMQMLCFNHLLDLSLSYHTKRNTGEVMRIIDRGSAINELFRTILFEVFPTVADVFIGLAVFLWLFGPLITVGVMIVMIPYIGFSVYSTRRRQKLRQSYIDSDVSQRGIVSDVLNNWESVKYFTSERREIQRFEEAVDELMNIDYTWRMGFQTIYAVQSLLLTFAFAVGAMLLAIKIMNGRADAAVFVVYIQYFSQFTTPLNQLSSLYKDISRDVTDAEKMLNLLGEKTEIKDPADAKELIVTDGVIEFDNVTFSYDGKKDAIKNISFRLEKGESMALVGETGSGKSTILRLLYRFYDVSSGHIYIDGQDISTVTQESLRKAIGIVPQDSVLWNDTIGANIAYGKPDSSDEEIIEAAIAGRIHDKIMTFDEQYETVVGERGVRLSGGEKQRVSLARMFLKSPAILVLDEATSALDTETEREIQKSLAILAKGRSSLSIAHRLSTIINSDKIMVMKDGEVVECAPYKQLMEEDGAFAKMWKRQIYTEAELLEDSDIEKVASYLPTSADFKKSYKHEQDESKPKDAPSGGDEAQAAEGTSAETVAEEAQSSDDKIEGFAVDSPADAPPPIAENPEAVSFAEATKVPTDTEAPAAPSATETQEGTSNAGAIKAPVEVEADKAEDAERKPDDKADAATTATPSSVDPVAEAPKAEEAADPVPVNAEVVVSTPAPETSKDDVDAKSTAIETEQTNPSVIGTPTRQTSSSSVSPVTTKSLTPVPFPTAPPNPKRMSTSGSIASALSEQGQGQSSPARSTGSGDSAPSDAKGDKRRKRLSSIKGFVRRISDQGGLTRSPSGLRSPTVEDLPITPSASSSPLASPQVQNRLSLVGTGANTSETSTAPAPTVSAQAGQTQNQQTGGGGGGGNGDGGGSKKDKKKKKKNHGRHGK
ncbi:hypothetical protein CI109_101100 [Kwoniella shandongensis]|uniref:Uncharacterized protein n=1 Tax=Kwoniella shandongensis TaxID=1734106 RepID=A0A5M6C8R5_9TREE|nr:uncharacterized protein CI109_001568 [Kwoniella shandongensis]KAA5530162.1 hypothetical protein CI109_001568 [Kwoniella shandongensis]